MMNFTAPDQILNLHAESEISENNSNFKSLANGVSRKLTHGTFRFRSLMGDHTILVHGRFEGEFSFRFGIEKKKFKK